MKRVVRRLLIGLSRILERSSRAATHLAAGLSPLQSIRSGIVDRWNHYAADDAQIDAGLFDWEAAFATTLPDAARVLVVGCGTGRDVAALARRGHLVIGIDPAPHAIDVGRAALAARGLRAELNVGFFEDRAWPADFEAVWFSYYTYSYLPTPHRVPALRRAAAALRPGGRVFLSVFRRRGAERLSWLGTAAARLTRNDWIPGPGDRLSNQPPSAHLVYEHYFDQRELDGEFAAAGLRVITTAHFGTIVVLERADRH